MKIRILEKRESDIYDHGLSVRVEVRWPDVSELPRMRGEVEIVRDTFGEWIAASCDQYAWIGEELIYDLHAAEEAGHYVDYGSLEHEAAKAAEARTWPE